MPDRLTYRLTLERLLREAQRHHPEAQRRLGFIFDYQEWFAAYVSGRTYGLSEKEANIAADDEVKAAHAAALSNS